MDSIQLSLSELARVSCQLYGMECMIQVYSIFSCDSLRLYLLQAVEQIEPVILTPTIIYLVTPDVQSRGTRVTFHKTFQFGPKATLLGSSNSVLYFRSW
jgi:hypothetical protein